MAASLVIAISGLAHAARSATEREVGGGYAHSVKRAFTPRGSVTAKQASSTSRSVTPCADARHAVAFYKSAAERWRHKMGAGAAQGPKLRSLAGQPCPQLHRAVRFWRAKAHAWRLRCEAQRAHFRALYEKWRCIHEHEGAWNANTGNGYYGGLQMTYSFQRAHGGRWLARWGTANRWPVWAQLEAAEDAWHDDGGSFREWGTAGMCGLA